MNILVLIISIEKFISDIFMYSSYFSLLLSIEVMAFLLMKRSKSVFARTYDLTIDVRRILYDSTNAYMAFFSQPIDK